MAKLTLHEVRARFRADMFLSSLAESRTSGSILNVGVDSDRNSGTAIAMPMGMSGDKFLSLAPSTQEILTALDNAEKLFWADLAFIGQRGKVLHVRDTVVSLALIRALQTSLGNAEKESTLLAVNLLGSCLPLFLPIPS
jgi:separase